MIDLLISSFLVSDVGESLILLKSNERFAQVAQRKWEIVSESLRSLTKNEQITHSLIFGQKTSDLLGNQVSEIPALLYSKLF